MKDNNKKLLETIFKKHLKFFDNEFIMNLLVHYKNKLPILNQNLYKKKLIIININYQPNWTKILKDMVVRIINLMFVNLEIKLW